MNVAVADDSHRSHIYLPLLLYCSVSQVAFHSGISQKSVLHCKSAKIYFPILQFIIEYSNTHKSLASKLVCNSKQIGERESQKRSLYLHNIRMHAKTEDDLL